MVVAVALVPAQPRPRCRPVRHRHCPQTARHLTVQLAGRAATDAEATAFMTALNKKETDNPTVVTTTVAEDGTPSSTTKAGLSMDGRVEEAFGAVRNNPKRKVNRSVPTWPTGCGLRCRVHPAARRESSDGYPSPGSPVKKAVPAKKAVPPKKPC